MVLGTEVAGVRLVRASVLCGLGGACGGLLVTLSGCLGWAGFGSSQGLMMVLGTEVSGVRLVRASVLCSLGGACGGSLGKLLVTLSGCLGWAGFGSFQGLMMVLGTEVAGVRLSSGTGTASAVAGADVTAAGGGGWHGSSSDESSDISISTSSVTVWPVGASRTWRQTGSRVNWVGLGGSSGGLLVTLDG